MTTTQRATTQRTTTRTDEYHDQDSEPTANAPDPFRPTGPDQAAAEKPALVRWTQALERTRVIDRVQEPVHRLAQRLVAEPRNRTMLHGTGWLGHAAHPLLTDLPLGAWTSSTVLDLIGGRRCRPASRRLIAFGVLTAVPTALTGVAEWAETSDRDRRVGFVHALGNSAALGLYAASWSARRRDRHAAGVLLSLAGGVVASGAGYLGGHLTLARKVASRHPAFRTGDDQAQTPVG
ncbi:DUF2231 domain-containing protein [Phytoactinopolyspora halotolerans]|uniref:DUF2231 domain-containing protein n=1 Tax=Phytoactinopolyspora halotolerans TaxID=1981512 RepID=A0A6L9SAB8_9ACTN|nr:DUF2231 domain-containing protein [Phytoactinopolyspora halotolerans]NEE02325.1 DUF2231 domain-containing protein [Phytoactinopolyspora halotolerans]